jgi:hypothetical protein
MQLLRKLSTGLAVAGCMAVLPATARADVIIQYSINGGAQTTLCTSLTLTCNGTVTVGGVTLNLASVLSDAPGTPQLADLVTSVLGIVNNSGALASVKIWAAGSGFTNPTFGLLENKLSGTSVVGTTGSASLQSCAFAGVFATPLTCSGVVTGAANSAIISNFSTMTTAPVVSLGTPYSMEQILTVTALSAGGQVNFANTTDITAAPEPATMTLMATGFLGLVGFARRRRKSV